MPGFTTSIVHSDRRGGIEHGSLQKPIHATVAYGYEDVQDLADVFQGRSSAYSYGRQVNPTITALETKIKRHGARRCHGMLRDRDGRHRHGTVRPAAPRRPLRVQLVPVRQHQQPVPDLRASRHRRDLRRRHPRSRGRRSATARDPGRVRRDHRQPAHASGGSRGHRRTLPRAWRGLRHRQYDDVALPVPAG